MIRSRFLLASLILVAFSTFTSAAALVYDDNRLNTTVGSTVLPSTFSNDGDGSLNLQTVDGKASVTFENTAYPTNTALGTLGNLSSLTAEYLKNSGSNPTAQFAYRILTNQYGSQALIWENQYNGNSIIPVGSWQSIDLTNGNFWQRANGANLNAGSQAHPLSYYTAGNFEAGGLQLSSSTPVYGIEIAYGSGAGALNANVDNVNVSFGSTVYTGNVSVPEPASLALFGFGAIALLRRRR